MKIGTKLITALILLLHLNSSEGQSVVNDLSSSVERRRIVLESAHGTGASSGSAINGIIRNETDREINIDVFASNPVFLVNRGSGQNMVVTQIYGRDGSYVSDGKRSFITLRPREQSQVVFVAYCADFEKENPTESDQFILGQVPTELRSVVESIAAFARTNPNRDITAAAQVAIWLAQGINSQEIAKKFSFSPEDERLAYTFLR